jgi:2-polyprenyl-3-methyl-5-hydroxy-6-metoxy-1,4-benzoquinol methylase
MINKTQLNIGLAEKRQIIHRDYLAHCFRWSHIVKHARIGQTWLDIGCGDFPLAMMLYTNRYKPKSYTGIDMRKLKDQIPKTNFSIKFIQGDFIDVEISGKFDNIVCLEMLEHVEKKHGQKVLAKIAQIANKNTKIYLSTPNYDGKHKAGNHVHEWAYVELMRELNKHFKIKDCYGTFASQKDIVSKLSSNEMETFKAMEQYYDSNLLSIMFAPMHPHESRNILWVLSK